MDYAIKSIFRFWHRKIVQIILSRRTVERKNMNKAKQCQSRKTVERKNKNQAKQFQSRRTVARKNMNEAKKMSVS